MESLRHACSLHACTRHAFIDPKKRRLSAHLILCGQGHVPTATSRGRLGTPAVIALLAVLAAAAKALGATVAIKTLGVAGGLRGSPTSSREAGGGGHAGCGAVLVLPGGKAGSPGGTCGRRGAPVAGKTSWRWVSALIAACRA